MLQKCDERTVFLTTPAPSRIDAAGVFVSLTLNTDRAPICCTGIILIAGEALGRAFVGRTANAIVSVPGDVHG